MRQNEVLITLEGRLVVTRALALPQWRVTRVLVTSAAHAAMQATFAATPPERQPSVEIVTAEELTAAGGFHFHQGCLAFAERPAQPAWGPIVIQDLTARRTIVVVLDDVRDPDNVGSIFRSALAFGVRAALLGPGCADPLYRKAIRTSMAATLALPFARLEPWPDALDELRQRGFTVVAATPDAAAEPIDSAARALRDAPAVALLVGSEGSGLSAAALARADRRVRIPIVTDVDSLNVATATAILLYEIR